MPAAGFADNHVHVLAQIDPNTRIAEFARQLKGFSSRIVSTRFPDFEGWQEGYYAESVNWRDLD